MVLDVLLTHSPEQSDGRGRSVQVRGLPLVDKVPVSRGGWVDWRRLEHRRGDTIGQWTVDDVSVTGDPSDIGHTGEFVLRVNVKDVLDRQKSAQQVSTSGVDDTLWLAGGSRRLMAHQEYSDTRRARWTHVKDEQGVLRVHWLAWAEGWHLGALFVPPLVPALGHWDILACSSEDQDVVDQRALLESSVDD